MLYIYTHNILHISHDIVLSRPYYARMNIDPEQGCGVPWVEQQDDLPVPMGGGDSGPRPES